MALHVIILISDLLKKKGHKKLTGPSSRTTNLVLSKAVKTFLFNEWKLLSAALLCSIMMLLRKNEDFFFVTLYWWVWKEIVSKIQMYICVLKRLITNWTLSTTFNMEVFKTKEWVIGQLYSIVFKLLNDLKQFWIEAFVLTTLWNPWSHIKYQSWQKKGKTLSLLQSNQFYGAILFDHDWHCGK